MTRAVGPIVQMQQEEKCGLDVSCGWGALEVKVTLTFHVVEVSGDCRRKRSQDSRGKERQRSSDSRASLTTQEAKDPWRGGESGEQVQMQMEQSQDQETDRVGGLSDRTVETGNKAGNEGPRRSKDDNSPAPRATGRRMGRCVWL